MRLAPLLAGLLALALPALPAHAADASAPDRAEQAAVRAEAAAARSEAAATRTEAAIDRLERLFDALDRRQGTSRRRPVAPGGR